MDKDKELTSESGGLAIKRKGSTVDNYEMEEEDFIKTMRRALSVPPMPRKSEKKAQPAEAAE